MAMLFRGSKVDLSVSVDRETLIEILKQNLSNHLDVLEAAMAGYRKELVRVAELNVQRAQDGLDPERPNGHRPRDYSAQYDRALGMLRLSDQATVSLSMQDYARFVEDDWDWSDDFAAATAMFGGG